MIPVKNDNLPITEELDFHYLLALMPPLSGFEEFSWLPELFATIGHKKLIQLCRYAGGETIRIPTLDELETSLNALQCFYDVYIAKRISSAEIPTNLAGLVRKIRDYYAGNSQKGNTPGV